MNKNKFIRRLKGELTKLKVKSFKITPRFILNLNNYHSNGSKKNGSYGTHV
jgi:hypothetical protein